MMGQLNHDQGEFFYSFRLDETIPDDHPVRAIAGLHRSQPAAPLCQCDICFIGNWVIRLCNFN
jgi:hypothetical protein